MTVLEFAGAPGAGKSALAAALARRLAGRGLSTVMRGTTAPASAARFVGRHPAFAAIVLAELTMADAPWADRRLALRRLLRDAAQWHTLRRRRQSGIAVLSEGLVQRAVGLYVAVGRPPRLGGAARYAARAPAPDVLVHVRAPLPLCLARAARRGLPRRLQGAAPESIMEFLAAAATVVDVARGVLERRGVRAVVVDNAGRLADAAGELGVALDAGCAPLLEASA